VLIWGCEHVRGYLNNPRATTESITPDGWFKTGDIAIVDNEGFYYIVDRKKELIKYKGFQGEFFSSPYFSTAHNTNTLNKTRSNAVPPADLEGTLLTHPEIADAGVIGVYSQKDETELPRYVMSKNALGKFHNHIPSFNIWY